MPNRFQVAGGVSALLSVASAAALPQANQLPPNWISQGCYSVPAVGDLLSGPSIQSIAGITVEYAEQVCAGYEYLGLQNGNTIVCGNYLNPEGIAVVSTSCDIPCNGNPTEFCGAISFVNVYQKLIGGGPGNGGGYPGGYPGYPGGHGGPSYDDHSKYIDKSDKSTNTDASTDNSSYLSPVINDTSRTTSPDIANGIGNGDHTLASSTDVSNSQSNDQSQGVGVQASPKIGVANANGASAGGDGEDWDSGKGWADESKWGQYDGSS